MSDAVEVLTAAIVRLEQIKVGMTPGLWGGSTNILGVTRLMDSERYVLAELYDAHDNNDEAFNNLEAILVLHSAIDPVLECLRDNACRMRTDQNQHGIPLHYRHVLAVADAILGDTR